MKADHFNTGNLIQDCKQDTSLFGSCYTYLGGMKDVMGFFTFSTPEQRAKAFCLLDVPTKEIVETLSKFQLRESDPHRITDFLIDEFCD